MQADGQSGSRIRAGEAVTPEQSYHTSALKLLDWAGRALPAEKTGAIQTHAGLLHGHPHIHVLVMVTCGAFTPEGDFLEFPEFDLDRLLVAWPKALFSLYLAEFTRHIPPKGAHRVRYCRTASGRGDGKDPEARYPVDSPVPSGRISSARGNQISYPLRAAPVNQFPR